jgi:hypothetical protein
MNYIEDFNKYMHDIHKTGKELSDQLSKIDGEQEDILHFLELANYDAVTMVKVTKKLKEIRSQRREIKNNLAMIHKIQCKLGVHDLAYTVPDTYTCRSDVLSDFMHGKTIKTRGE